ncbi:MAG TPA: hypothetical protein PLJ31_13500 [Armatimonadota bacterium]|nr:hypothetical protein [Armatimonadota bacterium]
MAARKRPQTKETAEQTPAQTSRIERRAPKPEELNPEQRAFFDMLSDEQKEKFLTQVLPPVVIDVGARDAKKQALQSTIDVLDRIIEKATERKAHLGDLIKSLDDGLDPSSIDLRKEATMPDVDGAKITLIKGPRGGRKGETSLPLAG